MSRIQRMAVAGVLALVLAVAGHAADGPDRAQASAVAASMAEVAKELQAQQKTIEDLEGRVKSQEAAVLEVGRKQVDWWMSELGVMTAVLSVVLTGMGMLIPYLLSRKDKELFEERL